MGAFYAESSHPLDAGEAARAFERLLASPAQGCTFLAEEGERSMGYVVLTWRYAMEHGGLSAYVDDLFVRPEFRRRGVASTLLDAVMSECATRACRALHVEVGESNAPARRLYERYGLLPAADGRILLGTVLHDE